MHYLLLLLSICSLCLILFWFAHCSLYLMLHVSYQNVHKHTNIHEHAFNFVKIFVNTIYEKYFRECRPLKYFVKHITIFNIIDIFTSEKVIALIIVVPKNNMLRVFIRSGYFWKLLTLVHLLTISWKF